MNTVEVELGTRPLAYNIDGYSLEEFVLTLTPALLISTEKPQMVTTHISIYYLTFLVVLLLVPSMEVAPPSSIQPRYMPKVRFTYQSRVIRLNQWLTIFTLSLAPLVTHIAFGLARHVVLRSEDPKWIDSLAHFNPISIVWRYYAIADRRFRARQWDQADMAACNAVFWDGTRWDGSEAVMVKSRDWITKLPTSSHVEIISGSSLATVALTLQGIQATTNVIGGLVPKSDFYFEDGLPGLFQPLAVMGLLRLQAACWLSSDYGFSRIDQWQFPGNETESGEADDELMKKSIASRLVDARSSKGIVFRIWWALSILALASTVIVSCTTNIFTDLPRPGNIPYLSATSLALDLMYLLLSYGALIHFMYLLKGQSTTTVLPCIQSLWYKCYTFLLIVAAATCVVLGALETRIRGDGSHTTYPKIRCDDQGKNCNLVSVSLMVMNISTVMP